MKNLDQPISMNQFTYDEELQTYRPATAEEEAEREANDEYLTYDERLVGWRPATREDFVRDGNHGGTTREERRKGI